MSEEILKLLGELGATAQDVAARLGAEQIKARSGASSFQHPIVHYVRRHLGGIGPFYLPLPGDLLTVVNNGRYYTIELPAPVYQGTPKRNLTTAAHSVAGEPVRVRLPGFREATVGVDCLHVVGNRELVGGPIRAVTSFDAHSTYLYFAVEDNRTPDKGASVDRAVAWIGSGDLCDFADFILFVSFDSIDPPPVSQGNQSVSL
jgi:hypothetical protein